MTAERRPVLAHTHSECTQAGALNREKSSRHAYLWDQGSRASAPLRGKMGAVSGEGLPYSANVGSFDVRLGRGKSE